MTDDKFPNKRDIIFYLSLTAIMLARFFPFGIAYYPYLDDHMAYGVTYHLLQSEKPWQLYVHYGMYTARPLAGLLDIYVIAPLWRHMWAALFVMVLLHAATLPLMAAVFNRCKLVWGRAASILFGLYPLLGESTYWINAASRIVPGFFFLTLSAFFLCRYFEKKRGYALLAAALTGILSLGFYEQTVSVGFVLYFVIIFAYRKHFAWYVWPFAYIGIFGAYYGLFLQAGRMASRVTQTGFNTGILRNIGLLLGKEQIYNIRSLLRVEAFNIHAVLIGLCICLAAALVYFLGTEKPLPKLFVSQERNISRVFTVFVIIFLFLAAFGPFFILRDSFLTLRSLFFCLPALAMLAQLIWDVTVKYIPKFIYLPAAGLLIWLSLLLSIGSVNAFRVNYRQDSRIAAQIVDFLYDDDKNPSDYEKVWLFGARYQFTPHGGVHLHSAALSDWSLSTLVNEAEFERFGQRYILPDGGYYMNPVVIGWRYAGDISAHRDLLLAVDSHRQIEELRMEGPTLVYVNTNEIYGALVWSAESFLVELFP